MTNKATMIAFPEQKVTKNSYQLKAINSVHLIRIYP